MAEPAESLEMRVARLVREYAQNRAPGGVLDAQLSLRDDLGVESLSLVSLLVRLGDELAVDLADADVELGRIATIGDLVSMARRLTSEPRA
jgi:acyl carrier protein